MSQLLDDRANHSAEDEPRLERIFEAFEDAWLASPRPRVADYLPGEAWLRRAALIELVLIDQEYRIRTGSPTTVEDYLAEFPDLAADTDVLFDLVARECRLRRKQGETPSVEDYLDRFPDLADRLEARLRSEAAGAERPPGSANQPEDPPVALPDGDHPRYDGLRFHARGGLGDVYRARDVELSREVALKRIRQKFSSESKVRRRFLREARLTARLNHPGVVPIHNLIWDRDNQPWYVMRFVEGQTLSLAIETYHDRPRTGANREDQPLAFRKLLARFVAVCDTVGFAHSRDVVHRDLKPANVILGEYGETIVLDWGLATAIVAAPNESGTCPHLDPLPAPDGEPLTQAGQILGTPAFMSPEQASGSPAMNRPASDIHGLGAILYTILTGRAPFEPQDWEKLREKIIQGHYPRPREVKADLPRALEAICRKAMAREPADRYETAGALARDVERWAADEPVAAYREPWTRRARRWARKNQTTLATAATAATVAAILLGVVAGSRIAESRKTDAAARPTIAQAEVLAIEARTTGDLARWDQALAELLRARERLESGNGGPALRSGVDVRLLTFRNERAILRQNVEMKRKDHQVVIDLDEARLRGAGIKDSRFDRGAKQEAYLAAFVAYGIDVETLPVEVAARKIRASERRDDLIAALDDWSANRSTNVPESRLSAIARAADIDPGRSEIRDAIARRDQAYLRNTLTKESSGHKSDPSSRAIFTALLRLDPAGNLPFLESIRREQPADFWLNFGLASAYAKSNPRRPAEAISYYRTVVALRPNSPGVRQNLGINLLAQGEIDWAIAEFREATRLHPGFAEAHTGLADALSEKGDKVAAMKSYQEALRLKPGLPQLQCNLAIALLADKETDAAIEGFQRAIHLDRNLAEAHRGLGDALSAQGKYEEAIKSYREAIRLKSGFIEARTELGVALSTTGDHESASAEFLEITKLRPDHAEAFCNLGYEQMLLGRFVEALASLQRGDELGSKRPNWPHPSAESVRKCRRLVELDARLPDFLKGTIVPANTDERLELASLCLGKSMPASSARFSEEAFADRPDLANDLTNNLRYNAACQAALAGTGRGKDVPMPDEADRSRFREKALAWLRADLAAWSNELGQGNDPDRQRTVAEIISQWARDPDLAGIREEPALVKLPDGEAKTLRAFWAEVEALRRKAAGK